MPLQLCMLLLVTGCNMFLTGRPWELPSSPPGSTGFPGLAWLASKLRRESRPAGEYKELDFDQRQ